MKKRGFTLSETLISVAIYATFLIIICRMYVSTFGALRAYDQPLTQRQAAYSLMNHLSKAIRCTPAVLDPSYPTMLAAVYSATPFHGLVLRDNGRVLGYRINGERLEELAYNNDYDPTVPSTTVPTETPRLVCANATVFEVGLYSPDTPTLVALSVGVRAGAVPLTLQTLVNFREAQ